MKNLRTILFLFIFLVLVSCQAKQGDSDGDLFSGHLPTTNSFTLQAMTTRTYASTEVMSFTVNFPFDILIDTTGGNPRLRITVGSTTRYATYTSQADLTKLVFNYTVAGGENDTDGIDVNALELNGSTLKFDKDGVLTNCDVASLTSRNVPNVKVDTTAPTITAFAITNTPGMYNEGESILFRMTFSETVVVTGIPKFTMTLDTGGTVDVNYLSGTGSNILIFSYVVGPSVADINGFNSINSPIVNGTIKDAVGNNSSLIFSAYTAAAVTYSASIHISGEYPYIVDTHFPANGTYLANQNLDFVLEFDQAVTVTGAPYLTIDVNGTARQAAYTSGSGTSLITFRYTTIPGDVDANGISLTASINQNSGNIVSTATPAISFFTDALNNTIPLPNTSGIILNSIQPQATAVARNIDTTIPIWGGTSPDNIWIIGQDLNITVSFNTQMYVTQTAGTPYIPITIGSTTRNATYLSGGNGQTSLVFRYTIQVGDLDTDNTIAIGNIVLNGGVITDNMNTNTLLTLPSTGLASTKVDGVRPTVSSVSVPATAVYSQIAPYNEAAMIFTVNWSEPVNYGSGTSTINMDVGGSNVLLNWNTGTNNASGIPYSSSSLSGKNDANGVAISSPIAGTSVIKDQAGNLATAFTFTPPSSPGVTVDTTAPTVVSVVAATTNGTYHTGQDINFTVTFSEAVTPTVSGSYPRIVMTVGSTPKDLKPITTGSSTTHTFRYTIVSGDLDTNGVSIASTIESSASGHVRDAGRNNIGTPNSNTFTLPVTSGIIVDAVAPTTPTAVASSNKTYISGEVLSITVTYNENVTVDTSGGTPSIAVDFAQGTDNFIYASGSGSPNLVFSRTLTTTHFDMDGLPSSVGSISLNGGTIQDNGQNNAPTSFATALNLSQIFVTYPQVVIWVRSDFINMAPPGSAVTVSNPGAATYTACGSGTGNCRIFNGDDAFNVPSGINNVDTVFMAFKTPATLVNHDIFNTAITLNKDIPNNAYDLNTFNADIWLDGVNSPSSINHDLNMTLSSTHILEAYFTSSHSFSSGALIDTTFNGAIGEVIVIDGILNSTQLTNIKTYMDSRY